MTLKREALQRISNSVIVTERATRENTTGKRKPWGNTRGTQLVIKAGIVETGVGGIKFGGSGNVVIYRDVSRTQPEETVTAYLDWLHGDQDVNDFVRVHIYKVTEDEPGEEDKWRIFVADCNPEIQASSPGDGGSLVAAGTTQGAALLLTYKVNKFITVTAGVNDGALLPSTFTQGDQIVIRNGHATDTLKIYPNTGDFIDEAAVDISISLAAVTSTALWLVESDKWISVP